MQRYATIVVVGGGCYGSYYVRQLQRAARAGALSWERLVVVDRDPECRVAREARTAPEAPPAPLRAPEVVVQEWRAYFDDYLARAADARDTADAIVPSPLMPHLMSEWVLDRARARWPQRSVGLRALGDVPGIPWQRPSPTGTRYVSFAEWMCPVNCIEPAKCPVTRGPRSWSLPDAVRAYVETERAAGRRLAGPAIFHCTHRAYGVGMFDTREVVAADRLLSAAAADGPADVLVGTMSHCHGALDVIAVGEPVSVVGAAATRMGMIR